MKRLLIITGILAMLTGTSWGNDSPFGVNAHIAYCQPSTIREELLDSIANCGIKRIDCDFNKIKLTPIEFEFIIN